MSDTLLLPEGWIVTKFTDVLDIQGGTQPPKSNFVDKVQKGYIRLLQIRDFGDKPIPTFIPITSKLKLCDKDDLLIGRYGASLGRICTGMKGAYNVALTKVLFGKYLDRKFLKAYLESELFQASLRLLSRSAQNGFNKDDLNSFVFLLPPFNEQKIIAEKLDLLLAQAQETKSRLEQIPELLKQFRQSVLSDAVSGKLTEDLSKENYKKTIEWKSYVLGDLAYISTGKTPSRKIRSYWENGNIPWLTSSCTGNSYTYQASQFITDNALKECSLKLFPKGTLLLAMYGEGKTRGQVTELKISGTCNQACAAIIVKENINREFIKICLRANYEETRKVASGGAQPNLNLNKVKNIHIQLPIRQEEQNEIVRRVEQLFAYADKIEQQVNTALEKVNHLPQSILAKAFRGELTTQWRAENVDLITGENSAASLLEKIQVEREQNNKNKKKK